MSKGYSAQVQRQRAEFVARCEAEGLPEGWAERMLRQAATATRLAVATCNGDWPAEGEWACGSGRKSVRYCDKCQAGWARGSFNARGECPDCASERRIKGLAAEVGIAVECSGDPRGAVVKVKFPSGRGNSWGDPSFYCVPSPEL